MVGITQEELVKMLSRSLGEQQRYAVVGMEPIPYRGMDGRQSYYDTFYDPEMAYDAFYFYEKKGWFIWIMKQEWNGSRWTVCEQASGPLKEVVEQCPIIVCE